MTSYIHRKAPLMLLPVIADAALLIAILGYLIFALSPSEPTKTPPAGRLRR
jgi:hypothetical protein